MDKSFSLKKFFIVANNVICVAQPPKNDDKNQINLNEGFNYMKDEH
jgi:hypothetical protein